MDPSIELPEKAIGESCAAAERPEGTYNDSRVRRDDGRSFGLNGASSSDKFPVSLSALSAIGTSTDPQRASLAIAGSDQMRFTLPSSLSSMRVSLTDNAHGIELFKSMVLHSQHHLPIVIFQRAKQIWKPRRNIWPVVALSGKHNRIRTWWPVMISVRTRKKPTLRQRKGLRSEVDNVSWNCSG
jgi:hypothetical protein